jgi:two-component system nitrogen regulation sensor histidine kinase NtrY
MIKMQMSSIKRHIFLILSLVFLGLSALNFWIFEKDAPGASEEYYISAIQNNIKKEIKHSKSELFEIASIIQATPVKSFANFETSPKSIYPYYVFKNGKVLYWSDHRYVPHYQDIASTNETKILNKETEKYIVNRVSFDKNSQHFEVFSLINIYRKFRNENEYLKSGYNNQIFYFEPREINIQPSIQKTFNITDDKNAFLFSVIPPQSEKLLKPTLPTNTLLLLGISVLFFGGYILVLIFRLWQKHQFGRAFLLLLTYLVFIRFVMLANSIPFVFYETDLFNPKFLPVSGLAPSLGDLLLNAFFIFLLIAYWVVTFYRSTIYYLLLKSSKNTQKIVSVGLVIASLLMAYLSYRNLCFIYEKSEFVLDFSLGISFSTLKIGTLLFYLILSINFFLAIHLFASIFLRLNKVFKAGFILWLLGFIIGIILFSFIDNLFLVYFVVGIYFLVIYAYKLPRFFYHFKYRTSLYFFTGAFVFALIGVKVIYTEENKKAIFDKKHFGERYLSENDLLGEGLLSKVIQTIQQDTSIQKAISRTVLAQEQAQQIIKNQHLAIYFDKYDTEVLAFDSNGKNLDESKGTKDLAEYEVEYRLPSYQTANANIYFINDVRNNFTKQYFTFIPIEKNGNLLGTIILDLKLRDEYAKSVYPELLMNKKFEQTPDSKNYSYAIFDKNEKLIFSSGSYNYIRKMPLGFLSDEALFDTGVEWNNYHHIGLKGKNNRTIIISSKYQIWRNIFANFSFLFLLSVLLIVFVMFLYVFKYGLKSMNVNFATKIQLYLNAAFLLPLILVVIITLSVINSTFINNQEKAYLDNTKNITSTIQLQVGTFLQKLKSKAFLQQEINDLAHDTKLDINLYDMSGRLVLTTRPLVYEYGLLSNFINPEAYRRIIEEKENEALLSESLGQLKYKTAYVSIKEQDGKPMGVVGIPFFDAKPTLDRQVTDVVASILSVFAWLFLILLIISYFASNLLTNPLHLVAQKLKKTNLDKLNERLEWKSDDEIGLLMHEYNKMLKKLEDSKIALSQSEKQTAWREMAKQVAHEIKNPLTPMKLSIQQLQRTLVVDNPKAQERITRALNSLTEQIDNISEIANSFSEFAKMPVPRNEYFDLVPLIQKSADLYAEDDKIALNAYIKEKEAWVVGDRQFMSRVITNLIINGIQSVPKERRAIINLRLYKNEDDNIAIIEVQDNGSGVSENIRQKVFIPNFTTKVGGSGLGLAMARRGVEHAGGNIWFETSEGKGTTFFIDLPLAVRG